MTTIPSGSFIVNMGVVPQTVGNGLKPYGMIYDLIKNYIVPIKWVIAPGKVKDGIDFTYNGVDYKGGPFIISAEYRSAAVNTRIAYWQTQGVVGTTTTSPVDVPVAMTLTVQAVPRWTMDLLNGKVAVPYFTNAGIPSTAYSLTKQPSELSSCDDIFVMPHAYPQWSTHSNLYFWNKTYHGSIWLSCTAGSELEDMFNPADHTQQTNFLSEKDATVPFPTGTVTTVENALVLYSNHTGGSPPYTYTSHSDQFMQFMGTIDAATQNGLEQIYIPKSPGWRSSTTLGAYDPTQPNIVDNAANHRAAVIVYGRGFGDPDRGYVMIEAAHSLSTATQPANIAAQRVFFNFSFMAGKGMNLVLDMSGVPASVSSGVPVPVSFSFPVGYNQNDYTVTWSSACGGTFVADPTDNTKATYTPPVVTSTTSCPVGVTITDACGRVFNSSKVSVVSSEMQITNTLTKSCYSGASGSISMAITGAVGAFNWSWTKGSSTGSGSSASSPVNITGLAAGTYSVTVTSGGGSGSSKTFSVVIQENPAISALSISSTNLLCNGLSTGAIAVADASGGTPPFSYAWSDGSTTQNRTSLAAGTYSLTATDAAGCSVSSGNITLTQPSALSITPSITAVGCNGQNNGAITLAVSGGTGTLTYLWNDGVTTQDRSSLTAGTYSVTVTDGNGCTKTQSNIVVSQPAAALSLSATTTNVACNGGSTGAIDLTPTGGTTPYTYAWSGGITTQDRSSIPVGDYTVTVTDANSCTASLTKSITQPATLTLSTTLTAESCPGALDGAIAMTVSGGTSTYSYAWSGPSSYTATTKDITGLKGGSYAVTVTDAHGCTATATVTVKTTNSNPVAPSSIKH